VVVQLSFFGSLIFVVGLVLSFLVPSGFVVALSFLSRSEKPTVGKIITRPLELAADVAVQTARSIEESERRRTQAALGATLAPCSNRLCREKSLSSSKFC
jgi:hypothetical protein